MPMNKREGIGKRTIIILIVVMIMAVALTMLMINYGKELVTTKPINSGVVEEVTTKSTTQPTEIKVNNFAISLMDILKNEDFTIDYAYTSYYEGAKFDFNCTKYDESENTCLEGSALMTVNTTLIPLFVYQNSQENYFEHAQDYYIIVTDQYIILLYNTVPTSAGEIKVYDREGNHLKTLDNAITGYNLNNKTYDSLYPNITENRLYYYTWHDKAVKVASVSLNDIKNDDNALDIVYEETITGATLKN